jgi:hypothetical protein
MEAHYEVYSSLSTKLFFNIATPTIINKWNSKQHEEFEM